MEKIFNYIPSDEELIEKYHLSEGEQVYLLPELREVEKEFFKVMASLN